MKMIPEEHAKIYQEIGRFVVNFEGVVECARLNIYFASAQKPDQLPLQILLADKTARSVFESLRSLFADRLSDRPEELAVLDKLIVYCMDLCEVRNLMVHGSWFIGYRLDGTDNPPAFDKAHYSKIQNTARGLTYNFAHYDAVTIGKYADIAFDVKNLLLISVGVCYGGFSALSLKNRVDELPKLKFKFDGALLRENLESN